MDFILLIKGIKMIVDCLALIGAFVVFLMLVIAVYEVKRRVDDE